MSRPGSRIEERGDVLAFLRGKEAAAGRLAAKPEAEELARDRARQLQVIIEEIEAGLHVPDMVLADALVDSGQMEG